MTQLPTMPGARFLDPAEEPSDADEHYTPRHLRAVSLSPELQQALDEAFAPEHEPAPERNPEPELAPQPAVQPTTEVTFPDPAAYSARRVLGVPSPQPVPTGGLFRRRVDPSRLIVPSPTERN